MSADHTVVFYDQLMSSPVVPLISEGFNVLIQAGHGGSLKIPEKGRLTDDDSAFAIVSGGEHIAVVLFTRRPSNNELYIRLGYVEPSSRGLGLSKILAGKCVEYAREHGFWKLSADVHTENKVAVEFLKRMAAVPAYAHYEFLV